MKTLGGGVLVTPVGKSEPIFIPVGRLKAVYESDDQTQAFLNYIGGRAPLAVIETLPEIWNQQATDGNNLNMVLCTNSVDSRRTIQFTHHMKQIVANGAGAKIVFDELESNLITTESLATIYGYQGAAGSVNLGMVYVTRTSDSVKFIEFAHKIKSIDPYPETGAATGSIITFAPTRDRVIIDETPTSLYTNQPK